MYKSERKQETGRDEEERKKREGSVLCWNGNPFFKIKRTRTRTRRTRRTRRRRRRTRTREEGQAREGEKSKEGNEWGVPRTLTKSSGSGSGFGGDVTEAVAGRAEDSFERFTKLWLK